MSLVPAFEIGVWNAWIFVLAWLFFHLVPLAELILRYKYKNIEGIFKKSSFVPLNKTEKKISNFWMMVLFLLLIYSVFLPLQLGTVWFYIGLAIFILGVIVSQIAGMPWATTPLDEPITKGLYRYSRHPIYFAVFLQYIGVGIASASWLFLLLLMVSIILSFFAQIIPEERFCLEKYGDAYRDYMNRTPRWIGIPK